MPKNMHDKQTALNNGLKQAFRYGTSAFRLWLIPEGVSDHLPITSVLPIGNGGHNLLSWNLLAEEHLFNNFMNISGTEIIKEAMNQNLGEGNNIYNRSMYHLFAELSQFIVGQFSEDEDDIIIDKELLTKFQKNSSQPSRLTRSRDPQKEQSKVIDVERAREAFVALCLSSNSHEYQIAIKQSISLIYHIKNPKGVLRWENRFLQLKNDPKMLAELCAQDILTFQECSSPRDIEGLLSANQAGKKMSFISHNIRNSLESTDNVVIAYDQNKYSMVDSRSLLNPYNPLRTDFNGKKPALFCKLRDKATGDLFIIGSIHHPGGDEDLREEIVNHIQALQDGDSSILFFIAGDYNHTPEQFNALSAETENTTPELYYPEEGGTLSGGDYGNNNQSIDAIMSNENLLGHVKVSASIKASPPAPFPFRVNFHLHSDSQKRMKDTLLTLKEEFSKGNDESLSRSPKK